LLRRRGVTFRFGEAVTEVTRRGDLVLTTLASGRCRAQLPRVWPGRWRTRGRPGTSST